MRSVHMHRSTQAIGSWVSPARLGKSALAPVLPTVAGCVSFIGSFAHPLSCVPWLQTVFPPFVATTDALTSAGRLFGPLLTHEHRTCPGRKFTAYRNNVSCHSVSNHVMCASGIFSRHRFSSSLNAGFGLGL